LPRLLRELLAGHGEVPLLLSRRLRWLPGWCDDAPELELRGAAGGPAAKADLIAAGDGSLIIAEAKSSNTLGSDPGEIASPLVGVARFGAGDVWRPRLACAVLPGGAGRASSRRQR